jgi:hypothetical protein
MGLFDKSLAKGHANQKKGLLAEAEKAGCAVVGVTQIPEEVPREGAAGKALSSAVKSIFGGSSSFDTLQLYQLETKGVAHVYVQPYSGVTVLPGEHHVLVPGGVAAPVAYVKGGLLGGKKWRSSDEAVAAAFKGHRALAKVAKKCKWEWHVGMSKIELEWTVQVRSLGGGTAHVVLKSGRYGGLTTYAVGFAHLWALLGPLQELLTAGGADMQEHAYPPAFEELCLQVLGGAWGAAPPGAGAS